MGRARQLCPGTSDVDFLGYLKRVVDLNAEMAYGVFDPSIDLADMEWGAGIAWEATHALAHAMQDFMPRNEHTDKTLSNIGFIERKGPVPAYRVQ